MKIAIVQLIMRVVMKVELLWPQPSTFLISGPFLVLRNWNRGWFHCLTTGVKPGIFTKALSCSFLSPGGFLVQVNEEINIWGGF